MMSLRVNCMDKLKFGVIGINGRGGGLAREIASSDRAEVCAIVDLNEEAAKAVASENGGDVWTDYEVMLSTADIDAVVIATPHHLHAPMGHTCLSAGLHTFIEKPIANTVSEADHLVDLAEAQGVKLGIGHNYRAFPGNVAMKKLVDGLGDIHRVLWQWIDTRSESYYDRDVWRSTWGFAGGGVLLNQTSHDLDLLCWMLGEPAEVSSVIGNWGHRFEVEDTALASIRFKSGAVASVQFSICDRPLNYRQVSGDRGTVEFRDDSRPNSVIPDSLRIGRYGTPMREYISGGGGISSSPTIEWEDIDVVGERKFPPFMDDFIGAVLDDRDSIATGASARTTIELINGIILSGIRKEVVSFPLDRDEYNRVFAELKEGRSKVGRL
jgi:UDP-N-acetyl-2-amino-2-deoxyglucuronate dehydrogenase